MKQYDINEAVKDMDSLLAGLVNEIGKEKISISQLTVNVTSFPCDIYEIKNGEKSVCLQLTHPPRPVFYFKKDDLHSFTDDIKQIQTFLMEEDISPVRQVV